MTQLEGPLCGPGINLRLTDGEAFFHERHDPGSRGMSSLWIGWAATTHWLVGGSARRQELPNVCHFTILSFLVKMDVLHCLSPVCSSHT